jgi:tRNA (cytidine56-2'-O)-methyltransferase
MYSVEPMNSEVGVLRLGHRLPRDSRLTTHVFLASRALGARLGIYSGQRDPGLEKSVAKAVEEWGGGFTLSYAPRWKQTVNEHMEKGWEAIHLTMYGLPHRARLEEIRESSAKKLVIVGGEKVPGDLFKLADYNLSVTNQPHSEVAALAIFLYDLFEGKVAEDYGGKIRVEPSLRRKIVLRNRT